MNLVLWEEHQIHIVKRVHVQQHHDGARNRIGLYFQAGRFRGAPVIGDRRLNKIGWYAPAALPDSVTPHVAVALAAWGQPEFFSKYRHIVDDRSEHALGGSANGTVKRGEDCQ